MNEIKTLADSVVANVKDFVGRALTPVLARLDEFEQRLSAIPAGPKGDAGERGNDGKDGVPGVDGKNGVDGKDGMPGERGADGVPGERGTDGANGIDGKDGAPGEKGIDGKDGLDAYEIALKTGFSGTVEEFVASMRGEKGIDGVNGKDGAQGEKGIDGANGRDGVDGVNGKDGAPGIDGKDFDPAEMYAAIVKAVAEIPKPLNGKDADEDAIVARMLSGIQVPKDGAPGLNGKDFDPAEMYAAVKKAVDAIPKPKDGESVHPDSVALMVREMVDKAVSAIRLPQDGEPGRDALDLDIVDEIEPGRSYAFATFAKYDGGLVKALRHTDPIELGLEKAGWQVVVDGVKSINVVPSEDLRTFTFSVAKTSGAADVREIRLPVVIHRGVFREGIDYRSGDATTWDGSLWIAQRDTQDKPGTSDAWRLSVKRGRDGKDAK